MYATLADFLNEILNGNLPLFLYKIFSYINTFGLFVALAFLSALYFLRKEIDRRLLTQQLPQIYRVTDEKAETPEIKPITSDVWVNEIFIRAAIGGMIGAKLFHLFEYWDEVIADPMGMIFSASGLTFYGGLIVGAIAVLHWAWKNKIKVLDMCDAAVPSILIAYAVGRMGCQFAGDGDWGIYNTAYTTDPQTNKVVLAKAPINFKEADQSTNFYFSRNHENLETIEHKSIAGVSWLPNWFFAYNYPHNVNSEGVLMNDCKGNHCTVLPQPVFPTPFYEIVMTLVLFAVLWRMRLFKWGAGALLGVYLIFNGSERFLIEQIRVNSHYHFLGISPTQAEIIAVVFIITGFILFLLKKNKPTNIYAETSHSNTIETA